MLQLTQELLYLAAEEDGMVILKLMYRIYPFGNSLKLEVGLLQT